MGDKIILLNVKINVTSSRAAFIGGRKQSEKNCLHISTIRSAKTGAGTGDGHKH